MSAAAGLAQTQIRAMGLTLGALYAFHAVRGLVAHAQVHPDLLLGQQAVSALAWAPGVLALVLFLANRIRLGLWCLGIAALTYPVAVALWPLVNGDDQHARLAFWIHQIPGLAAVAALVTLPRWLAWTSLFVNCLGVELVMRRIGVVDDLGDTLVRSLFSLAYSGFFFVLVASLLGRVRRTNRMLARSAREKADAAIMAARDTELVRLDRLTHDFVLSLLSSAAEGVPADKLRVQAESVRRQLTDGSLPGDGLVPVAEVADRIARRAEGYGVEVVRRVAVLDATSGGGPAMKPLMPRAAAVETEAAVEEAVRNTVRHGAGTRRLTLALEAGGLTAQVQDEGPGFAPHQVQRRLGVSQSIMHRMNTLPGGSARIDSAPGHSTTVTIHWNPA